MVLLKFKKPVHVIGHCQWAVQVNCRSAVLIVQAVDYWKLNILTYPILSENSQNRYLQTEYYLEILRYKIITRHKRVFLSGPKKDIFCRCFSYCFYLLQAIQLKISLLPIFRVCDKLQVPAKCFKCCHIHLCHMQILNPNVFPFFTK